MTLSPPIRAAVLEVVRRLRDPMRECHVDSVGFMVLDALGAPQSMCSGTAALGQLRAALGLQENVGTIARWARGKSREEVAQALERIATSPADER